MFFTAPDQILTVGARVERVTRELLLSACHGPFSIRGPVADLPLAVLSAVVGNRLNTSLGIGAGLVAAFPVHAAHASATRAVVDEWAGRIAQTAPEPVAIEVIRAGVPDTDMVAHARSVSAGYHRSDGPRGTLLVLLEEPDPLEVDYTWPSVMVHVASLTSPVPDPIPREATDLLAMCNEEAIVAANIMGLRCFRARRRRIPRRFGPELLYKVYGNS